MADKNAAENRDERDMTSLRVDEQSAARRESMPEATSVPKLTGIIGDKSAEAGENRSGEDVRRRGWYWNWNTMVTQFAPLIGLDGKGLLDSYIVWTDRREDSPFRGFAFPSTTSEANFYGIDRNVLGTINKILVSLDLIEIKKSMVNRPDQAGNDWKFPHNTYRVKDQGDNFQLTTEAVYRVVKLATEDQAVYRRIKHIFGSKFKPIDPQSVWYEIIAELESTPNWQKLRAVALEDEHRTSERSRKGHAARRKTATAEKPVEPGKSVSMAPVSVTQESSEPTATTVGNDTLNDSTVATESPVNTTAAKSSNALETSAEQSSNGSNAQTSSDAAHTSKGSPTVADPTSTMQYTNKTTTTTDNNQAQNATSDTNKQQATPRDDFGGGPDDSRDRELTLRLFDEANEKPVSIAARRVVGKLAIDFNDLAQSVSLTGWALTGVAIEEAVSSGSTFVAPKRVREILIRWRRDGVPAEYASPAECHDRPAQVLSSPVTSAGDDSHRSVRTSGVPQTVKHSKSRSKPMQGADEIWQAVCALLATDPLVSRALHAQLVSDAHILRIDASQAELQVSDRLIAVLSPDIQRAMQMKLNVAARKPLQLRIVTGDAPTPSPPSSGKSQRAPVHMGSIFDIPGSGMTNTQLWAAVRQALSAAGDIPRVELDMWASSSTVLALSDATFVLGFNSGFLCRRAEHRLADLEREFAWLAGFTCEIEIVEADAWRSQQQQEQGA